MSTTENAAAIKSGDRVQCRTAFDEWIEAEALSEPRYDQANAFHRLKPTFLSVSVQAEGWQHPINWPAEDVRLARQALSHLTETEDGSPLGAVKP